MLAWVAWWNGEHTMDELGDVDPAALWMFTLEDDRKTRKITTKGVARGRGRHYVADWMVGRVGTAVRLLRYMPYHEHEVAVFDADTGAHLGSAMLANQVSAEQIAALLRTRARKARQLRTDLASRSCGLVWL